MDDTRHITKDQYEEIECALDDMLHNADAYSVEHMDGKSKAKDECLNMILNILCLDKPDDIEIERKTGMEKIFSEFNIGEVSDSRLKQLYNLATHIDQQEMGYLIKEFMKKEHISIYSFGGEKEDESERYSGVAILSDNLDDHVTMRTTINELEESLRERWWINEAGLSH